MNTLIPVQCWKVERVVRRHSYVCAAFLRFQMLEFGNHFSLAVFQAISVNVLILVVAVLR